MIVPTEDFVTPWSPFGHYGFTHVRIWFRCTPFGAFQRHEWRRDDGSIDLERWIVSGKLVPPNTEVAQAEDDESDLIKVLEQIAAGHNDARTLAAEALAKMRDKTTQRHT